MWLARGRRRRAGGRAAEGRKPAAKIPLRPLRPPHLIPFRIASQLGLQPIYRIERNPLPWMDEMLNGAEHTNFFENRSTEYSKAATQGTWDEVWESWPLDPGPSARRAWTVNEKKGVPRGALLVSGK